jgi:Large polyvalent protein associated domain 23
MGDPLSDMYSNLDANGVKPVGNDWRDQEAQANLAALPAPSPTWTEAAKGALGTLGTVAHSAVDTVRNALSPDLSGPAALGDAARKAISDTSAIPQKAIEGSAADLATMGSNSPMKSVPPVADATMLLAGGGVGFAEKDAAGIFGGRLSKTADYDAQKTAVKMEAAGATPSAIWSQTGTVKGADGEWRQEIDDSKAKLLMQPSELKPVEIDLDHTSREGDFTKTSYMDEVLNHPELYKAYPELKDIKVEPLPDDLVKKKVGGDYNSNTNTIRLNPNMSNDQAKSVILHEVQHAIQKKEGFALGDNPANHIPAALVPAETDFMKVRADTENEVAKNLGTNQSGVDIMKAMIRGQDLTGVAEGHQKVFGDILANNPDVKDRLTNIVKSEDMINDAHDKAFTMYKRSMGETEARNVQKRRNMTPEQRRSTLPVSTEDVPRFLQRNSKPTASLPAASGDTALNSMRDNLEANGIKPVTSDVTASTMSGASAVSAEKKSKIGSLQDIKDALASNGGDPLFVRYSRGPNLDMRPGANSMDHQTGQVHNGLSAVELNSSMSDGKLVRYLRDYASGGEPHVYSGQVTGIDSDGSPSIRPTKYIGKLSKNLTDLIGDESVPNRLDLQQMIAQHKQYAERASLTPRQVARIAEMESKLSSLGGPVNHPGLGKNFSLNLSYGDD